MTRQELINAITAMLEEADFRALRLIWVATRNLTRKPEEGAAPMTEHPTRAELTAAIAALLDKADYRKLRLVWVYASHLIG